MSRDNSDSKPVISVYFSGPTAAKLVRKLRIEAAKRGMTISKYVGLLIKKATSNFTDFDVGKPNDNNNN